MNDIDQMTAGPDLDRLVAEMMGDDIASLPEHAWRKDEHGEIDQFGMDSDNHNGPFCERCMDCYCVHCDDKPEPRCEPPIDQYTTTINEAWRVVEKMTADGFSPRIGNHGDGFWWATFQMGGIQHTQRAKTAPLAICRAALKAAGKT